MRYIRYNHSGYAFQQISSLLLPNPWRHRVTLGNPVLVYLEEKCPIGEFSCVWTPLRARLLSRELGLQSPFCLAFEVIPRDKLFPT